MDGVLHLVRKFYERGVVLIPIFVRPLPLGKTKPRFLVGLLDNSTRMDGQLVVDADGHKCLQASRTIEFSYVFDCDVDSRSGSYASIWCCNHLFLGRS